MGTFAGFLYHQITTKPKPLPRSIKLNSKVALVTGSSAGIGLEAAKQLASHGLARLILAVRTPSKGEAVKQEIQAQHPDVVVEVWQLDHEDWSSIDTFGKRAASLDRLDIAILDAGLKNLDYIQSPTGHEQQIQVNHLGTALVSVHIVEALDRTAKATSQPSRLTIVSSENHFWCKANELKTTNIFHEFDNNRECFKEPDRKNRERYSTSKLLNVLWMRELSARVAKLGIDIVINTVNPGLCITSFHHADPQLDNPIIRKVGYSAQQGGHILTDAAVQHGDSRGAYLSEQKVKKVSAFVLSQEGATTQAKVWSETVALFNKEAQPVTMLKTLNEA